VFFIEEIEWRKILRKSENTCEREEESEKGVYNFRLIFIKNFVSHFPMDNTYTQSSKIIHELLHSKCIMGILNVTPDSFYDGGKFNSVDRSVAHAMQMKEDGAKIIDIGAVSTRPGSVAPSEEEEWKRLSDILREIRNAVPGIFISVDTWRSSIAEKAVNAGADMINDISGGTMDPKMYDVVGRMKIPYVLMHIKGTPENMQVDPQYDDVVNEVKSFFLEKIFELEKRGVTQLIIDPGFGFGKTLEHNLQLLEHLPELKEFHLPILAGISRKSMVTKFYNVKREHALEGTLEMNRKALANGANILRVHDVKENVALIW
jgi:dihydropteroate synthase